MITRRFLAGCAIFLAAAVAGCDNPVTPTPTPNPTPNPQPNPGPVVVNTPPTITAVRVQGLRTNQPPNFADLSEEIDVAATVTDTESQPSTFAYNWSAPVGTFVGSGATLKWRAPAAAATPLNVILTLEVVETYTSQGQAVQNKVTRTATVRLHDSVKEVTDISQQFLRDFSTSSIPAVEVMRNFQLGCHGTAAELSEVEENRTNFRILEYEMGPAITTVNFGGVCVRRSKSGDACSRIPMEWSSRARRDLFDSQGRLILRAGEKQDVRGVDSLAAVYDRPAQSWKLCSSDWDSGARSLDNPESIRGLVP